MLNLAWLRVTFEFVSVTAQCQRLEKSAAKHTCTTASGSRLQTRSTLCLCKTWPDWSRAFCLSSTVFPTHLTYFFPQFSSESKHQQSNVFHLIDDVMAWPREHVKSGDEASSGFRACVRARFAVARLSEAQRAGAERCNCQIQTRKRRKEHFSGHNPSSSKVFCQFLGLPLLDKLCATCRPHRTLSSRGEPMWFCFCFEPRPAHVVLIYSGTLESVLSCLLDLSPLEVAVVQSEQVWLSNRSAVLGRFVMLV